MSKPRYEKVLVSTYPVRYEILDSPAGEYMRKDDMVRLLNQREELEQQATEMVDAAKRSGYDFAPCGTCGIPIVCIPDGMPICESCGKNESEGDDGK